MAQVSTIELESFEDMVLLLHSRMTPMNMVSSLLCNSKRCFTIITATDEHVFIIMSPNPPMPRCRFAYVDEQGHVKCSEIPPSNRPVVCIVAVKSIKSSGNIVEALASSP